MNTITYNEIKDEWKRRTLYISSSPIALKIDDFFNNLLEYRFDKKKMAMKYILQYCMHVNPPNLAKGAENFYIIERIDT